MGYLVIYSMKSSESWYARLWDVPEGLGTRIYPSGPPIMELQYFATRYLVIIGHQEVEIGHQVPSRKML